MPSLIILHQGALKLGLHGGLDSGDNVAGLRRSTYQPFGRAKELDKKVGVQVAARTVKRALIIALKTIAAFLRIAVVRDKAKFLRGKRAAGVIAPAIFGKHHSRQLLLLERLPHRSVEMVGNNTVLRIRLCSFC